MYIVYHLKYSLCPRIWSLNTPSLLSYSSHNSLMFWTPLYSIAHHLLKICYRSLLDPLIFHVRFPIKIRLEIPHYLLSYLLMYIKTIVKRQPQVHNAFFRTLCTEKCCFFWDKGSMWAPKYECNNDTVLFIFKYQCYKYQLLILYAKL